MVKVLERSVYMVQSKSQDNSPSQEVIKACDVKFVRVTAVYFC